MIVANDMATLSQPKWDSCASIQGEGQLTFGTRHELPEVEIRLV